MRTSLKELRVFVAVAETGGIRLAAERLGRTVSAISMTLKQLEAAVGSPLFEGDRKSRLTKAGTFVLDRARELLDHYDRSWATVLAYARNRIGRIDVASVPSVAGSILPEAIRLTRRVSPNVEIDVRDMDSPAVLDAVRNGIVEIGFGTMYRPVPELTGSPLFSDGLELVCSPGDPLARSRRPVQWRQVRNRTFLANGVCKGIETPEFREILSAAQIQVHNVTSLLALVRAGVGVTVLPRLSKPANDQSIRFLAVADPTARRQVSVIVRNERNISPAGAAFMETVRLVAQKSARDLGIRVDPI